MSDMTEHVQPTSPSALPPLLASHVNTDEHQNGTNTPSRPSARRLAGSQPTSALTATPPTEIASGAVPEARERIESPDTDASEATAGTEWAPQGTPNAHPKPLSKGSGFARTLLDWADSPFRLEQRDGRWWLVDESSIDRAAVREIRDALGDSVGNKARNAATETANTNSRAAVDADRANQIITDEINAWHQDRLGQGDEPLNEAQRAELHKAVHDAVFKLGPAQALIELPEVTNLIVRGADNVRLRLSDGRVVQCPPIADSNEELINDIRRWSTLGDTERRFGPADPHLDLTLPDGSRLSASAFFTAYPTVTIRVHQYVDIDTDDLVRVGLIDDGIQALLRAAIRAGKTIVVSGEPESGKTSTIRAILNELHPDTPIATIESEFELFMHDLPHRHREVWAAQEKIGGEGGAGEVKAGKAIYISLRDSVSIIVVGEVRSEEVIAMLEAMQISASSVTTIHASSARGTVDRIVSCAVQHGAVTETWAYSQIGHTVDLIMHIGVKNEEPIGGRKHRFVDEIFAPEFNGDSRIAGADLYERGPDGRAIPTGHIPPWIDDLRPYGYDPNYWLLERNSTWAPLPTLENQSREQSA